MKLPSVDEVQLNLFTFDDMLLSEDQTILASVVMFKELGFVTTFHIDTQVL